MRSKFFIGCSGYYYQEWRKNFYPAKTAAKDWLNYYSTIFNTVELNGTFYRTPTLANLKKQYDATPEDFYFSAKMSRHVTHIQRLKDCKNEIREFNQLLEEGLREKLNCILYQMPPSFHYSEENLELIEETIPTGNRQVIEFRHSSWWRKEAMHVLRKKEISLCNMDYPNLQPVFETTTPVFYMRFHGVPELFKSDYTLEQLHSFYGRFPLQERNYIYFNNTYHGRAHQNALELMKIAAREFV